MGDSSLTCWTVIEGAAAGRAEKRDEFARRYEPVVRSYLGARWRRTPLAREVDDAVQEVFVDCFKEEGALGRVDPSRPGGFRAFLFGIVRNVALRVEAKRARNREQQPPSSMEVAGDDPALSTVFDRAWALAMLEQAANRLRERNHRHAELLRLRFEEGFPVREIARRWDSDPAKVHKHYARARDEFKAALIQEVAFHHPHSRAEVERECAKLLALFGN
jgi:RNA polymerase sigma-70 factor (ECF subfamily)